MSEAEVNAFLDIEELYLEEQLKQLEKEGLLEYYLYCIEKYNLPLHDENNNLFIDIISGNYELLEKGGNYHSND